jgi:hypothetical protein
MFGVDDPWAVYGLHLDWQAIEMAGQSRAVDMFLNFPVMDMNRNAIWRDPNGVPKDGIDRMNRFWGDESWRTAAYAEHSGTSRSRLGATMALKDSAQVPGMHNAT